MKRLFAAVARVAREVVDFLRDRDVSRRDKAIVLGGLLYFVFPLDLVPDLLLPFGYADDAVVLGAVTLVAKRFLFGRNRDRPALPSPGGGTRHGFPESGDRPRRKRQAARWLVGALILALALLSLAIVFDAIEV